MAETKPHTNTPEFDAMVQAKRIARMEMIDKHPAEIRELVHEYGWAVVNALIDVGVKKPNQIRHVVETLLDEFSPTRGSYSQQGIRGQIMKTKSNDAEEPTNG